MRRPLIILAVMLFAVLFAGIAVDYTERQSLPPLAANYVKRVPQELGAPNIITGILLSYRGFDTLGEVAVLFMVAAGVGLVLGERIPRRRDAEPAEPEEIIPSTELVQNGAAVLFPLISIFAAYIIMNGHLSAGGGFQGGAIIASGVMLLLLGQARIQDRPWFSRNHGIAGGCLVCPGRHRGTDFRGRISGQPDASSRAVRCLLQRGRHSHHLRVARCQGRL